MKIEISKVMARVLNRLLEEEARHQYVWYHNELDEGRPQNEVQFRLEIIKECKAIQEVLKNER